MWCTDHPNRAPSWRRGLLGNVQPPHTAPLLTLCRCFRISIVLCKFSQRDKIHWPMHFETVVREPGIDNIARTTLQHIFQRHHDILRRNTTHNPFLCTRHMEAWLAFTHMTIQIAMNRNVFTDEIGLELNCLHLVSYVSRTRVSDSNDWTI